MPEPPNSPLPANSAETRRIMSTDDFKAGFNLLRQNYLKRLPDRLTRIENLWQEFLALPAQSPLIKQESLQALQVQVHGLHGSGSSYGFDEISQAARQLEDSLQLHLNAASFPDAADVDQIAIMLQNLVVVANNSH